MSAPIVIMRYEPGIGEGGNAAGSQEACKAFDMTDRAWVIKPLDRRMGGARGTITEFVAARLCQALDLPVPDTRPVYLPAEVINGYPELANFDAGFVLGSEHHMGFDLKGAFDPSNAGSVQLGSSACATARGTVVADTWLCNPDRSPGSYASRGSLPSNPGNLLFRAPAVRGGEWVMYLIDFGHALGSVNWGRGVLPWPQAVMGTMSFFFRNDLIPLASPRLLDEYVAELATLSGTQIRPIIAALRAEMPNQWEAEANLVEADWVDLVGKLELHAKHLPKMMEAHYAAAERRYR